MIITGKYLMTRPGEFLAGGAICIEEGRIAAIGKAGDVIKQFPHMSVMSHDHALITPGFVNAHCHLELEFCAGKVQYNGNFIEWLQEVRNLKHDFMVLPGYFPEASVRSLLASGTTTLCDHYTLEMDFRAIEETGLRYFGFRELFEFNNHRPDLRRLRDATEFSFAVHSPYTASAEIAQAAYRLACQKGAPLSMHLSEMMQEIEFIDNGNNEDIVRLLKRAGAFDENWKGMHMSPIAYFDRLGVLAPSVYCVHLNYAKPGDVPILASRGITHVYCPRSHAYFMHPDHPMASYRAAGVNSCLGTDSYGSNIDLNILAEAKLAWVEFPMLTGSEIFAMITCNGLQPLGLQCELGRLEQGYRADVSVWQDCEGVSFDEMMKWLVNQKEATLVLRDGRVVHES
jgi:cytosine/adenosine deaminase-related metal-dependent hydrolase